MITRQGKHNFSAVAMYPVFNYNENMENGLCGAQ